MLTEEASALERFERARQYAVALTDEYQATPPGDPRRVAQWAQVVAASETARRLLEAWLGFVARADIRVVAQTARPGETGTSMRRSA